MSKPITDQERALMAEVNADPIASELLGHKCRWEHMTRYGVLREWGDPRTWPSYSTFKPSDYAVGDVLVVTSRSNRGEERRGAIVTAVNFNGLGGITIEGHHLEGMLPTGAGWFKPEEVGTRPYGLTVAVEKVGHVPPRRASEGPVLYRNPGYDLMHDPVRRRG